jgi:hypothetical protein
MPETSLATEMLQLSTSAHAWRSRHPHGSAEAVPELRPALEAFCRHAEAKQVVTPLVKRLAASAVRVAVACPPGDGERETILRELAALLDEVCAARPQSPPDLAGERVVFDGRASAERAD